MACQERSSSPWQSRARPSRGSWIRLQLRYRWLCNMGYPSKCFAANSRMCASSPAVGPEIPRSATPSRIVDYMFRWLELKFITGDQGELFKALPMPIQPASDCQWYGSGWSARRTYPDGRCARLQHLRFADGAERNLLPLHDVWKYKRVFVASRHVGALGRIKWR